MARLTLLMAVLGASLTGCSGGGSSGGDPPGAPPPPPPATFSVSGNVAGMTGSLTLENNGRNDLTVNANGPFAFGGLAAGTSFAITVATQPANQTCTVANGTGTVGSSNITNVSVTCSTIKTSTAGSLDTTFGSSGKATTAFGGKNTAMAVQADGKIVMAGGSILDFLLARYNADGTLDASFGTGGLFTTDVGGFTQEEARAVAVQGDGKILVAGNVRVSEVRGGTLFDEFTFALVRYNTDGSLDTTFGGTGKVKSTVVGRAFAIAVRSDGKILLAGDDTLSAAEDNFRLARFNADGSLDTTFGSAGSVVTDVTAGIDGAKNIVLMADDRIVLSGALSKGTGTGIERYTPDGRPDGSFGTSGSVEIAGAFDGEGLAMQSDGKLLLVGSKQVGVGNANVTQFELRRLNADGSVDDKFGSGGTVDTVFGTLDSAQSVAVQRDGKILVGGSADGFQFGLARYNDAGTLDAGFAASGKLKVAFFGLDASAESVAVLPDDKILLGGFANDGSRPGYALARINP